MMHYPFMCCWMLVVNFGDFYINMHKKDVYIFLMVLDTFYLYKQGLIKLFPKHEYKKYQTKKVVSTFIHYLRSFSNLGFP